MIRSVDLCMQGYKSLCAAVTICTNLVNIQTDTQTDRHRQTHRQTDRHRQTYRQTDTDRQTAF